MWLVLNEKVSGYEYFTNGYLTAICRSVQLRWAPQDWQRFCFTSEEATDTTSMLLTTTPGGRCWFHPLRKKPYGFFAPCFTLAAGRKRGLNVYYMSRTYMHAYSITKVPLRLDGWMVCPAQSSQLGDVWWLYFPQSNADLTTRPSRASTKSPPTFLDLNAAQCCSGRETEKNRLRPPDCHICDGRRSQPWPMYKRDCRAVYCETGCRLYPFSQQRLKPDVSGRAEIFCSDH